MRLSVDFPLESGAFLDSAKNEDVLGARVDDDLEKALNGGDEVRAKAVKLNLLEAREKLSGCLAERMILGRPWGSMETDLT